MKLRNLFQGKKSLKTIDRLSPSLPDYPVDLVEPRPEKSRRQILGMAIKGAALLMAWPWLKQEGRAAGLKNLVGDKADGAGVLSARKAAKVIASELAHNNVPHKNTAHQNVLHTDKHLNNHINESKHVNMQPQGFEHTNTEIHTNQNVEGHADNPHTDNPHTNEPHTNVEHANRPGPEIG
ncbi:MAG: hypothetical protein ACPLZD_04370 [Candidatus Saccharicenans sp.]|nr:MAG: hypothetical protein C0168_05945 [Candidatus Aminicenantes bacterium]HEK86675.1 hypothetical protein [Candidatus Aminicenantes bacterium]